MTLEQKKKALTVTCVLFIAIVAAYDIYIGIKEGEWIRLLILVMSLSVGYLLSILVDMKEKI